MNSVSKICLSLLISISLLAHHQLWANESSDEDDDSLVMEEIEVETSLLDPPVEINPTRSSTTFNREEIETRQPDNIFEVIEDIPGVSTSGGPRNNGYNLNIRGFGDNEDIIYKLDGAIKDYEKYRFGGTFIEPELLKSVEVSRGAATTASGSGALGGVVEMETKDASDFLKPGEKYGASTKYGHRFNNDEDLRSLTLFAAPFEKLDLLFNYTDRRSNDYKLTGRVSDDSGDRLPLSETNPDSLLGKVEYYLNDDMTLGFSYINFKQKGLENFDTTAVTPSIFGVVDRDTDDKTYATKFLYEPISDLIDFSITLGFTDTDVNEVTVEGLNPVGTVTNFKYDIWALDMKNISQFKFNGIANTLTLGIDGEYSDRETSRDLPTGSIDFFDQPSGIYQQYGVYFLNEFNFGNLTITPGMRWDYNHSRVTLDSLVDFLKSNNQKASDSFDIFLPSISSSFRIQNTPLTIFANYWEQYRPPKLDEYYTIGVFNRCVSGIPVDPQSITRTCGDLYQPEESENYDLGLLMQKSNLIGRDDLLAKITYFDTSVDNVLETLNSDPSNPLTQVGTETRDGIEVEMNYQRERSSFNISYSKINGEQKGYWVENSNLPGLSFQDVTKQSRPIYDIPGDTLSLAANYVFYEFNLDVGWRGSFVGKRKVLSEAGSRDATEVTLDSYAVHDIFANWRPFKNSQFSNSVFRFGIDNVTNKRYQLNEEDTAGSFSVARNVKMTFDLNF